MIQTVHNKRLRYVHDPRVYGDTHRQYPRGGGPNWMGAIHIDEDASYNYGVHELANTLMHEGFHGYVNEGGVTDSQEEADAAAFGANCSF